MLTTEDLSRLVALLDEGRAVVKDVENQGGDREIARVRLSRLLGDAIQLCDGGGHNGAPKRVINASQGASWSVLASQPVLPPPPSPENGKGSAAGTSRTVPERQAPAG